MGDTIKLHILMGLFDQIVILMSLLHIQGSLEVHWKLLFIFVPSICLSFLARGIENEDRFAEDEHKKVKWGKL